MKTAAREEVTNSAPGIYQDENTMSLTERKDDHPRPGYLRSAVIYGISRLQDIRSHPFDHTELPKRAVVFAPHQDDEILGCGGTIARKIAHRAEVSLVFMTDGSRSHANLMPADKLSLTRRNEAIDAASVLSIGRDDIYFLGAEDGHLPSQAHRISGALHAILRDICPKQIFLPYSGDRIPDHIATNRQVLDAAHASSSRVDVYEYPVWFWNFWPFVHQPGGGFHDCSNSARRFLYSTFALLKEFNCQCDIRRFIDVKAAALDCHRTQMQRYDGSDAWATLGDIGDGSFLKVFQRDTEIFKRYSINPD